MTLNIKPAITGHLRNVYCHLAIMLALSTAASTFFLYIPLASPTLPSLFCLIFLGIFIFTQRSQYSPYVLYAFATSQGLALGPLVSTSLAIHPINVVAALGATSLVFVCFTLSVMYAQNRSSIFVGALASSALSSLFWLQILNWFVASDALYSAELYLGLLAFSAFVLYDTQIMIARAEAGSRDYLRHSLDLYMDIVNIFVRVLAILRRKDEKESRRKGKRRED